MMKNYIEEKEEKLEFCFCKKDFIGCREHNTEDTFFKKGLYQCCYEDGNIFVFYNTIDRNENYNQGCRFHVGKSGMVSNLSAFYEFFDKGRLMKLKILEKITT